MNSILTELSKDGKTLDLRGTQVTDLTPLAGLTNLTELGLRGTRVTDLTPLAGLTNLTELGLYRTPVTDLMPLGGLTNLTWLNLRGTKVTDLTPLAGLAKLETLNLFGTRVTDLRPLAGLAKLTILSLVSQGMGVGFTNETARFRCPDSVVILPVTDLKMPLPLALVWRKDNLSPLLERFVAEVRSQAIRSKATSYLA